MNLGLIGISIQKSSSPDLHRLLGELYQLPVAYELNEPSDDKESSFVETLKRIRASGYSGSNVTYPFKQLAMHYCDQIDQSASRVGATNTLRISEGKIHAFNTDYTGFIRAYRSRLGETAAGKVLLIGAGGVGRAVAFGLFEVGASEVLIYDLNKESALSLKEALQNAGYTARVLEPDALINAATTSDGLVNCTPIGHYKTPGIPLPAALIGPQKWAFDAVYTPMDTEFLIACAGHGIKIISGFDLFFYQALNAFEIFTGIQPEADKVMAEYKQRFAIHSDLI